MDKALVFGTKDCRFESYRGRILCQKEEGESITRGFRGESQLAVWSSGMILRLGRRGPGFESLNGPHFDVSFAPLGSDIRSAPIGYSKPSNRIVDVLQSERCTQLCIGDLAQMVERSLSMREALGSMPRFSNFFTLDALQSQI